MWLLTKKGISRNAVNSPKPKPGCKNDNTIFLEDAALCVHRKQVLNSY